MEYMNQYQDNSTTRFECLLFDLDDTLYPLSSGLSKACTNNIIEFMVQKLGIEESKVVDLNQVLYKNYGTSMAGLKAIGYEFDNEDYHKFVHGRLPYENLKTDPILRNLLLSLPLRKIVFSNGDINHVEKALKRLGIEDCFEMIICFETLNPKKTKSEIACNANHSGYQLTTSVICKPSVFAFEQAFKIGEIEPQKTLFFDDSIRNIETGKKMGLHTVRVGRSERSNGADYALESIHNIKEAFPELWTEPDVEKSSQSVAYSDKVAVETSVKA